MLRATEFAHVLLRQTVKAGDWAVDATVGNGHDTLFLAQMVGPTGRVFGFDVQEAALTASAARVGGRPQVTLFHCGHERLAERLPAEAKDRLAAVMFNLGFLPGGTLGDTLGGINGPGKDIITRPETTLAALNQALAYVAVGGLITLVLYPGHPGGDDEAGAVRSLVQRLPAAFGATQCARLNALRPAPALIVIERLR